MCVYVWFRDKISGSALIISIPCDRIVIKRNQQPKNGICPQNVSNNSPKNHIKMDFFCVCIVCYHITCHITQTIHEYIWQFPWFKKVFMLFMESIINYCPPIKCSHSLFDGIRLWYEICCFLMFTIAMPSFWWIDIKNEWEREVESAKEAENKTFLYHWNHLQIG